ncbi:MAG: methyltransferase domain-containing protein [Vicinamibacterales bacterium]
MAVREMETPRVARPPRAMAWVVLAASAGAVLIVGAAATAILFGNLSTYPSAPGGRFWLAFIAACLLTTVSLSIRSLRWVFLLRRAETRIPIRDAYVGYFSGFSLLFAPMLAGEIAVRALVNRSRGGVPVHTTIVVNIWERLLDAAALAVLAVVGGVASGTVSRWSYALLAAAALSLITPVRRLALDLVARVTWPVARLFDPVPAAPFRRMAALRTWTVALATSIVAWLLPALGLWMLGRHAVSTFDLADGVHTYAASATASVLTLAPGGVLIAGREILVSLLDHGLAEPTALLIVLGVRLSTVGVSVALGLVFAVIHVKSVSAASATHFDDIADAYDVQIPESRRLALLTRKTEMMREVLVARGAGTHGLDVGCGQGAYVGRMRQLGFDVEGIDMSSGQVRLAARNVGGEGLVRVGSVLDIPAPDASFDFLYIINVLHHLGSVEEQRRAFRELFRVLKPGGLLFVHEINTRNILFRFYMGYVFPSLNCIDEGIERWLLAHTLDTYTDADVVDVRYFTFLPDFVPAPIARIFGPVERFLERSTARVFSAHYMAVLRK